MNEPEASTFPKPFEPISILLRVFHQAVQNDRDTHHEIDAKKPMLLMSLSRYITVQKNQVVQVQPR